MTSALGLARTASSVSLLFSLRRPPFVKCSKGKGDPATVIDTNWVIGLGKIGLVDQMTHNVLKRVTS
jgi:hypothetical protein